MNPIINRLYNILSLEPAERLIALSQESPQIGFDASAAMIRRFDEVLLRTQSTQQARAAAEEALPAFEERLSAWPQNANGFASSTNANSMRALLLMPNGAHLTKPRTADFRHLKSSNWLAAKM